MNTFTPIPPLGESHIGPGADTAKASAHEPIDTGLACLVMLSQFHAVAADPEKLKHEFSQGGMPLDAVDILNAAKSLGLVAARRRPSPARLAMAALPAIAIAKDSRFFIIARVDQGKALIQEPGPRGRRSWTWRRSRSAGPAN
jgi:subfamily B ATP-binding cassette protein HlyB/CyaB